MKFKLPIIVILAGLLFSNPILAYDDKTTHPALTDEIVDFYNLFSAQKLTFEQKEWIVQGAMSEDTPPRWINHFYDPIYKVGWSGENTGIWPIMSVQYFSGKVLSSANPVSSLDWLHNQKLQSEYGEYRGNRTWERAIYEYANENTKEAYYTLGFILHLIEDATVPDHTRNDTHAHELQYFTADYGSPYEEFNKQFTRNTLNIAGELKERGLEPVTLASVDDYLVSLAEYSNKYFFSKDTINDPKYQYPKIIRDDGNFGYGIDQDCESSNPEKICKLFPLVNVEILGVVEENEVKKVYNYYLSEKDNNSIVLQNYFTRLSREAVINGAGVVDLFLREGEKAKQNPASLEKPPQETAGIDSWMDEIYHLSNIWQSFKTGAVAAIDSFASLLTKPLSRPNIVSPIANLASPASDSISTLKAEQTEETPVAVSIAELVQGLPLESSPQASLDDLQASLNEAKIKAKALENQLAEIAQTPVQAQTRQNNNLDTELPQLAALPYAGFGGGGSSLSENNQSESQEQPEQPVADTIPPSAPIISSPADFSLIFTTAAVDFQGIAESSSVISNDFNSATTTAGNGGNWQLSLILPQGTTTLNFFAKDAVGNISSPASVVLFVDSEAPPAPNFSIAECQNSLAIGACLTATTTLRLDWSSPAQDLDYFELFYGNLISTTTALSAVLNLTDNLTYTFSLRARDQSGNWSATATTSAEISTKPVVINEVAWMGTASSTEDEWIELYNRTNNVINLNNWVLRVSDNRPYLPLSGTIPAKGYYLLERTDNRTISDLAADLVYGNDGADWALNNTGIEVLILSYASTTIDQTPSANWLAGTISNYRTMERYDTDVSGEELSNWGTNIMIIRNNKDGAGNFVNGTPKARNSVSYLIAKGAVKIINENIILTKNRSPYFVNNLVQSFQNNAVLTIEPGVVIKFYNDAGMNFNSAAIRAQGTTSEPIVFTSFYDDEYGEDTNGDATSSSPSIGDWYGVDIISGANSSILDRVIFRYAGKYYTPTSLIDRVLVKIQDTSDISIKNSVFEHSKAHGLVMVNSTSTLENNIFRNNNNYFEQGKGLFVSSGNYIIKNNEFSQNQTGLYLSDAAGIVNSNTFAGNTQKAISSFGVIGEFTNNSAFQNGLNGIVLDGSLAIANSTSTLKADNIPYVIFGGNPVVPVNSGLVIEAGAIVKGSSKGLQVNGRLALNGENSEDIILTSLYDDTIGGDTDNSVNSPGPGDWLGLNLANTASLEARGFTMRYAGSQNANGQDSAGLKIAGGLANIADALFDANYPYGIYATAGSELNISNSRFENHNYLGPWGIKAALAVFSSTATLASVSFTNNLFGIISDTFSTWLVNAVEFVNNTATTSPSGLF